MIVVDFHYHGSMNTMGRKIEVLTMIDIMNADTNVGHVMIKLDSNYQQNYEIVNIMINKYSNIYWIEIHDYNH